MGSRAGFIIKRNGKAAAYGSRYAGSSVVSWLLQGPETATRNFITEGKLDELEDVLGGEDGSALIDWDEKRLLWDMSNCHLRVHKRLCNRMIGQAFDGWDVRISHSLFELSEYVGIDSSEHFPDEDDEPDERQPLTDDDVWDPSDLPEKLTSFEDVDGAGNWITVRHADGTLTDYFGFDWLPNELLRGGQLVENLAELPSLNRVPHELITNDGLFIDVAERTLWRWHGDRIEGSERRLARKWDGWTLRDVPGGDWRGHVEITGRQPDELACSDRDILAATITAVAPTAATDNVPDLSGLAGKARFGCSGITLLIGLAGAALYWTTKSVVLGVLSGMLFVCCLYATIWISRKASRLLTKFDLQESPQDVVARIDRLLVGLDYPTIDELRASGELVDLNADDDMDDDDDE